MRASRVAIVAFLSLTFSICSLAQTSAPDPFLEYQAFLAQHQDLTTSDLLALHPVGALPEKVGLPWESVVHGDFVEAACKLTPYEKSLLQNHGFVVTERFRESQFINQMVFVWNHDLPVFISTDAILHALGVSYDSILASVESGLLTTRLDALLAALQGKLPVLAARYSADGRMTPMLKDVDVYLTIPRKLLGQPGQNVVPYYPDNAAEISRIISLIQAQKLASYALFSTSCKEIDFSQFTPRGHYADGWILSKYFQAMMWLGRMEMYLLPPVAGPGVCPPPTPEDIRRQTIDAVLVSELMDLAGANPVYNEIEQVLSFLAGEQDNVTLANLRSLLGAIHLENAGQLWEDARLRPFQEALKTQAFASQRILSQVLRCDPTSPQSVRPASAFLLFGQRFVVDSYITGNVVFDKIKYKNQAVCRLFPSTLDVLFALGNDVSGALLIPELDQYHYSSNLAALRYLVDAFDAGFWDSSIYNQWLNAIRALNPPAQRGNLPAFMQTAAWQQEKMTTQLASWAELRHAHLLYAKQSYSDWGSCSTPCGYVEPYPELYQRLSKLAKAARLRFGALTFSPADYKTAILDYFDVFEKTTATLATIAQKELDGTALTVEETTFLQNTIHSGWQGFGGCGGPPSPPEGWYSSLFYGGPFVDPEAVVADYHTAPSDCAGNLTGWVLHAGTGPADLAIVTAKVPGSETGAFVGPVLSYYEYTTTNFRRLTDEEWQNTDLGQTRPKWVSSYLADRAGESVTPDCVTVTVVDDFESYANKEGNRIYQTWIDGQGCSKCEPKIIGNGTGSRVDLMMDSWFAGQRIVYDGKQSMLMDYNNVRKPWYSQAERTWQAAQNWTVNGADTLTLYFCGTAYGSQAPLVPYVGIEDSAGHVAVATYPRADAVSAARWQRWQIPLTDLRAAGVDVAAVKKMVIGVGDRQDPKPGGTGRIYIDDIRLTKRMP